MRHNYELHTDVLATLVAQTPVQKKHAALIAMFATRTDFRTARYVKTRDEFGPQPRRVVDANDQEIAADYHDWIAEQLARLGSVGAVCEAFAHSGYRMVESQPCLHYLVVDRSPAAADRQDDFVQIEIWEDQEFVEREIFPRLPAWHWPDEYELRRGNTNGATFERRDLGGPRYRLETIIDMALFATEAEAVWGENHQLQGDRVFRSRNATTGQERVQSVREMTPGFDRQQWRGRRFFDDWSASSAGQSGARLCTRWVIKTSEYSAPGRPREMDFVPSWTHTRKIAALENTQRLDVYGLMSKLTNLDERVGTPFVWFSYGVHGNLVRSGQMERVLEAAESGLIVLPEHDYRVLRRWADDPYAF